MNMQAQHAKLLRQLRAQGPHALEGMYDAAAQALESLQKLAARGLNPVTAALDGAHDVVEWAHYPDGDARDDAARTRYYYHVHGPEDLGENEHGHFHVFVEPSPEERDVPPTHVVGIAMDATGRLLRLFTTNQWVTGETWRAAAPVSDSVDRFDIASDPSRRDLDRWLASIVRLFRVQIVELLHDRDAALQGLLASNPDALNDRTTRVLSVAPVDLHTQISAVEDALEGSRTR